jgi:hypothetical protein
MSDLGIFAVNKKVPLDKETDFEIKTSLSIKYNVAPKIFSLLSLL